MHKRLQPFSHGFVYRVFSFYLDLDEVTDLARDNSLFSHNRWNILSFWDKDHGPRDGTALRPWIDRQLKASGIDLTGGSVRLFCFPRLFGFAFNPLSIWFCHMADGRLAAILYEVRNTFGQQHSYLIPIGTRQTQAGNSKELLQHSCNKGFYVSPFLPMDCRYHFRITPPDETFALLIRQTNHEGNLLLARQLGRRRAFNGAQLWRALLAHPLMTFKVITAIHWQALHLWRKGARFHQRPGPPARPVTTIAARQASS